MKVVVLERVNHYHFIEVPNDEADEYDIEDILLSAEEKSITYRTGYEAIEEEIAKYNKKYNTNLVFKKNFCGTDSTSMEIFQAFEQED